MPDKFDVSEPVISVCIHINVPFAFVPHLSINNVVSKKLKAIVRHVMVADLVLYIMQVGCCFVFLIFLIFNHPKILLPAKSPCMFIKTKHHHSHHHIVSIAVIVGALGYFVDVYDLLLFSIIRKPSLTELGLNPIAGKISLASK